jgi:hypothetical protein
MRTFGTRDWVFELLVRDGTSRADGCSVYYNVIVVVKIASLRAVGDARRWQSRLGEPCVFMAQRRTVIAKLGIVNHTLKVAVIVVACVACRVGE